MRLRKIKRLTLRLQPLHLLFHGLLRIGLSATSNPSCQSTIGLGHQCSGSGRLCTRCDCRVPTTHNCLHGYKFVRARSLFCFFFARALVRSVSVLQFQPAHATSSISISISIAFLIFSSLLRFSLSLSSPWANQKTGNPFWYFLHRYFQISLFGWIYFKF